MKLKERIERAQTLILEHKLTIERMEHRITILGEHRDADEPMNLSIISQIEFFLLNLKVTVSMNEASIDDMIKQDKYEEMQKGIG